MASTKPCTESFLAAVEHRCSCYTLAKTSPIPDTRIHEIINTAVQHAPSAFNVQSARAIILLQAEHDKLWDIADTCVRKAMPEAAYAAIAPRIQWFRAAYGTVMWFEDLAALDTLKEKNPGIQHVIPQCMFPQALVICSAAWS
jgi:uncharacterized protein